MVLIFYNAASKLKFLYTDIKNDFQVYHNEVNINGVIKSVLDEELLMSIHKNYHAKAIEVLKELCLVIHGEIVDLIQ